MRGGKMGERLILAGNPPVEVLLKPSARARRLSLRVSKLDGRVTLTLPRGAPRREAQAFADDKADWIRRHLDDRPDEIRPMPGGHLLFRGADHAIVPGPGRAVRLGSGEIDRFKRTAVVKELDICRGGGGLGRWRIRHRCN